MRVGWRREDDVVVVTGQGIGEGGGEHERHGHLDAEAEPLLGVLARAPSAAIPRW